MTVTRVTNRGESCIHVTNAKLELMDVALSGCSNIALFMPHSTSETTVVATRCEFANNSYGARVFGSSNSATFNNCVFHSNRTTGININESTIHLHGEATAIHSNGGDGIYASNSAKVIIHLPSHHNTSYNNGDEDRNTSRGGTITNVDY